MGPVSAENESETTTPTVLDRLIAAGLSQQRIEGHLGAGRIELDGNVVTDPNQPAPHGTRLTVAAG